MYLLSLHVIISMHTCFWYQNASMTSTHCSRVCEK